MLFLSINQPPANDKNDDIEKRENNTPTDPFP